MTITDDCCARFGCTLPAADGSYCADHVQADGLLLVTQMTLTGIELGATGAAVTGPLDPDQVVAGLSGLSRLESSVRLVVGDLYLALVEHFGEEPAAVVALAPLGYDQAWLANSVEVCRKVPPAHRRAGLSWGHHAQAARLQPEEQERWLEVAEAQRWTIRQMEAKVSEWLGRDQGELGGLGSGAPPAAWRMPPRIGRAISEILAVDGDAWVLVHPKTGEVRKREEVA